ncbi:hypothetical protein R3P38DRAFT_2791414 [Favolaschia claudopus]|uniref:Uncharacterized protein n=1 Tax=Favolaschia claudopus TaxID=2862362 RepID=A0AAW0AGL8_9AGAR
MLTVEMSQRKRPRDTPAHRELADMKRCPRSRDDGGHGDVVNSVVSGPGVIPVETNLAPIPKKKRFITVHAFGPLIEVGVSEVGDFVEDSKEGTGDDGGHGDVVNSVVSGPGVIPVETNLAPIPKKKRFITVHAFGPLIEVGVSEVRDFVEDSKEGTGDDGGHGDVANKRKL